MKPSNRYIRDSNVMMQFRNDYVELLNNATAAQDELWNPALVARGGVSAFRWAELRGAVAQAAGPAGTVYERYGGVLSLRAGAYVMHRVNPVINWELSLRDPAQLPPDTVISAADGAIASARHRADEARDRERGLTGLIAAFIRWPVDLREAVGPGKVQRTAAGTVGVLGQILVGATAGALGVGFVSGAVALWRFVF